MTKERNESNCANEVMEVVGERIVSATNRRTRIEALATIVDIPYFSAYNVSSRTQHCALLNCFLQVLLSLPGVTRYSFTRLACLLEEDLISTSRTQEFATTAKLLNSSSHSLLGWNQS